MDIWERRSVERITKRKLVAAMSLGLIASVSSQTRPEAVSRVELRLCQFNVCWNNLFSPFNQLLKFGMWTDVHVGRVYISGAKAACTSYFRHGVRRSPP